MLNNNNFLKLRICALSEIIIDDKNYRIEYSVNNA